VRDHARSVLACDFFVTVTADFHCSTSLWFWRGTRRILHWNVSDHSTGAWRAHGAESAANVDRTRLPRLSLAAPRYVQLHGNHVSVLMLTAGRGADWHKL
jgi:hypothetical protein